MNDRVEHLDAGAVPEVVDVMCEAFFDYPVMRYVLRDSKEYESELRHLIRLFVMARVLRRELILGFPGENGLLGVALVSFPGRGETPPEIADVQEETWSRLGADARSRYEAFGDAAATIVVSEPHIHLNMIGARRSAQGMGVGGALLGAVHQRSAVDPESDGVTLSTEYEPNVTLYQHFGYRIVGSVDVDSAFTSWTFYRPDDSGEENE